MKFETLLRNVVQLIGGDSSEIDASTFRFVRDMASHRLRIWWDAAPWPDTIDVIEGYVDGGIFSPPFLGGEDVIEAFDKDPRKSVKALEIDYHQDNDGIHFTQDYDECFLRIKLACPQFTGDAAAETEAHDGEGQFFYGGDFWNSVSGQTSAAISQDVSNKVTLTDRSANYMVRAIYADYLRSNNQHEEANAEETSAEGVLNIDLERHYSRKGQTPKTRVKTYGN